MTELWGGFVSPDDEEYQDLIMMFDYETDPQRFIIGYGKEDDLCDGFLELSINEAYRYKKIAENNFKEFGTPKILGGITGRG